MFFRRSYQSEIMDDLTIKDYRIDKALHELKYVNKYLGGVSVSSSAIKLLKRKVFPGKLKSTPSVLDIGAGASDILLKLKKKNMPMDITSMDINSRACFYLKNNSTIDKVVCADINDLPFRKKFDLAHASLFLHHFNEEKVSDILRSLFLLSKAIIINDLRRSVVAYGGIWILTRLFSKSEMVKNDGPLSVKRGFTKKDWLQILSKTGINKFTIQRKWAFRWLIIIYGNEEI